MGFEVPNHFPDESILEVDTPDSKIALIDFPARIGYHWKAGILCQTYGELWRGNCIPNQNVILGSNPVSSWSSEQMQEVGFKIAEILEGRNGCFHFDPAKVSKKHTGWIFVEKKEE